MTYTRHPNPVFIHLDWYWMDGPTISGSAHIGFPDPEVKHVMCTRHRKDAAIDVVPRLTGKGPVGGFVCHACDAIARWICDEEPTQWAKTDPETR